MTHYIRDAIEKNRIFGWIAIGTVVLLLIPLIAMQLSNEVQWSLFDFIVMGALISGASSAYVLLARRMDDKHLLPLAAAALIVFVYIWAELSVGVFTLIGS